MKQRLEAHFKTRQLFMDVVREWKRAFSHVSSTMFGALQVELHAAKLALRSQGRELLNLAGARALLRSIAPPLPNLETCKALQHFF